MHVNIFYANEPSGAVWRQR